MKARNLLLALFLLVSVSCGSMNKNGKITAKNDQGAKPEAKESIVYFTSEISPESLIRIYEALGREASGRVAVKISTGEPGGNNYLHPALIGPLVKKVDGTIVECNTAYGGRRSTTAEHLKAAHEHGFDQIARVDIMDSEGEFKIPVQDQTHIKYDIVGSHLKNYDFMINLAHFKGHAMGGFGGVLKNQSIGVASADGKAYIHSAGKVQTPSDLWSNLPEQDAFLESMAAAAQAVHDFFRSVASADGKAYIHSAGKVQTPSDLWSNLPEQDAFLESMAAAAQAVHDFFGKGENIIYIDIMNNMSVDCDCDSHPADPKLKDMGIMASLDPVALDQACLDKVFNMKPSEGDDNGDLVERINSRHGTHTVDYAEKIGLGTKKYIIVDLDK